MKFLRVFFGAVVILVLLGLGIHLLVRTYVSRRASDIVKENLKESFGESVSFDSLLINLITSQAEIDNPQVTVAFDDDGSTITFNAELMVIGIPHRDLVKLYSLTENQFEAGGGIISLNSPQFQVTRPGGLSPLRITAASMGVGFSGKLNLENFSQLKGAALSSIMREANRIDITLVDAVIGAPQYFTELHALTGVLSKKDTALLVEASSLITRLLPSGAVSETYLPQLLAMADPEALSSAAEALDYLIPPGTDQFFASSINLTAEALPDVSGILSAKGILDTAAGSVDYSGLLKMADPQEHNEQALLEQLALQTGDVTFRISVPEVTAMLGGDVFSYSFRP